ncbi:oleate hydratase [Psychrobacter sp. SCQQ22]|uniref:oleate hydratase n=1 Tax=unclassified Psychrobacter TaxID=196806 RepID=UPI0018CE76BC|nr:oleate hydratase [Psychrobacter sp. SCQQ22]MBH0085283.1 oleate hydratase [Psychrobacter sp. SCQQ22]
MNNTNDNQKQLDRFPHQPDANKDYPHHTPQNTLPFADKIGNYQRNIGRPTNVYKDSKVYIIGAGIAGLSSAYYFIRDGKIPAENITFLEQLDISGGSMDGSGNAKDGYLIRGGREMEFTYENFWDVFQDIPAVEMPEPYSVLDEYRLINDDDPNYSIARLLHNQGGIQDFSGFELKKSDQLAIIRLLLKRKEALDDVRVNEYFSDSFFESNFWIFWSTMFAFEKWHSLLELKLYMHRFLHDLDGLHNMSMLVFPKYNQYDGFIVPLRNYLIEKGVTFQYNTSVTDLDIEFEQADNSASVADSAHEPTKMVKAILAEVEGTPTTIAITENDYVVVTTGTMTEDSRYGDNHTAPNLDTVLGNQGQSTGWTLWNTLANKSAVFGHPEKFNGNVAESSWMSATLTCKPSALIDILKTLSVNDPYSGKTATGGIITFTDSNWIMSFTCNRQPHFPDQPDDTLVLWVYSLLMDKEGNYVKKPMPECTGNEILAELCYHLGIIDQLDHVVENTLVRSAYMPYITSQFMARAHGDRPEIVPQGCTNLGLVGQFVETKNDVVFTIESSVRTARVAVYSLLNVKKQVPDIDPSQYDIRHLLRAANTLNDGKGFIGESLLRKLLKDTYYEHILPPAHLDNQEESKRNDFIFSEYWESIKGLWHK